MGDGRKGLLDRRRIHSKLPMKGISMGINRVIATGNLTREPELRSTQSGCPVLAFGLAVNERRKNASTGEWEDDPVFIDCTLFGTRGEALAPYLTKGLRVAIEGRMHQSKWIDKETGKNRSKIEIVVQEIDPAWKSRGAEGGEAVSPETNCSIYDKDIPF